MQFRVFLLTYAFQHDLERDHPDGFVITAGGPREARRMAHEHRDVSINQKRIKYWLSPHMTKIKAIGESSRKTPDVHLVSYVSA